MAEHLPCSALRPRLDGGGFADAVGAQPGVTAHSALLWLELPIRITGPWWCEKWGAVLD